MQKKDMNIKEIALAHSLSIEEFENIKKILKREPNYLEVGIFSAMWSEHCSYKSSKKYLSNFPTKAPWVIQGPGENAGVIDIGDGYAAVFKMESHNHPSFIEPYQGAATGVGGILRDVFTMGARPVANMNSIRFSCIDGNSETAKKHRYLLKYELNLIVTMSITLITSTNNEHVLQIIEFNIIEKFRRAQ